MSTPNKVYDIYAPILNYKESIDDLNKPFTSIEWIPNNSIRRIKAYEILGAYWNNISRDYRQPPEDNSTSDNDEIAEFGDAEWINSTIKNKILGDEVKIFVDSTRLTNNISILTNIIEDKDNGLENTKPYEEQLQILKALNAVAPAREIYLRDWWTDNNVYIEIDKNESKLGVIGDAVYQVYWDDINKKPMLKTIDAGFCFPESFEDGTGISYATGSEDISERMTIAWEMVNPDTQDSRLLLHREVYELKFNGTCKKQVVEFYVSNDINLNTVEITEDTFFGGDLVYKDLGIDFLPFTWFANVAIEGEEPFGISNLHFIISLLDNIMNSYTDLDYNSNYLGGAVVFANGMKASRNADGSINTIGIQPRALNFVGDGNVTLMDTSRMQDALVKTIDTLTEKLLSLLSIPSIMTNTGKENSGVAPSGYALTVLMQPLMDKIKPMRAVRKQGYSDVLEKIQKLYRKFGNSYEKELFKDKLIFTSLRFGNLLPGDVKLLADKWATVSTILDKRSTIDQMKNDGLEIDVDQVIERLDEEKKTEDSEFDRRRNDEIKNMDNKLKDNKFVDNNAKD